MVLTWALFFAFYDRWGLVLAPALKFPLGDFSGRMLMFILSNPTSAGEPDNWPVYLWLCSLWGVAFLSLKVSLKVRHEKADPRPSDPVSENEAGKSWLLEDQNESYG